MEENTFECTEPRILRRHHSMDDFEHEKARVRWLVPMDSTLNYFECEITRGYAHGILVGIGSWSEDSYKYSEMQKKDELCYETFSGRVYISKVYRAQGYEEQEVVIDSICTTGDRIGCGIDFNSDHHSSFIHVFFTKNGKQVGDRIRCKKPPFTMCPVIQMGKKDQRIHFLQHCNRPSLLGVSCTVLLRIQLI